VTTTPTDGKKTARKWVSFPVLAALALVIAAAAFEFAPVSSAVNWHTDLAETLSIAREEHKLVLINFSSRTCTYCRRMERDVFSRDDVLSELDRFVPVKIDVDRQPDVAARYNVYGLPTFMVTDADGVPAIAASGYLAPDVFIEFLRDVTVAR